MGYTAKLIADSLAPSGARLTTFELGIPKWVQAELNTHRMLSRNSASTRAIPTKKFLDRITNDPVVPVHWGKNQPGMVANEELQGEERSTAERIWRLTGSTMIHVVQSLLDLKLHKQVANRLLEPWMFTTVIATGTEWDNLWNLRCHPDAQPELRRTIVAARTLYETSEPTHVPEGDWHTPYVDAEERQRLREEGWTDEGILQVSMGRCGRVSFLNHDGKRAPQEDIDLFHKLRSNGHMSPMEHVAMSLSTEQWKEHGAIMVQKWVEERIPVGNFWGWLQYRKTMNQEHLFPKVA